MFKIVSDEAVPIDCFGGGRGRAPRYPFRQMGIGDSFVADIGAQRAAHVFAQFHPGYKFTTRKRPDGTMRVWRIAVKSTTNSKETTT